MSICSFLFGSSPKARYSKPSKKKKTGLFSLFFSSGQQTKRRELLYDFVHQTNTVKYKTCPKCSGLGKILAYNHINNGICYSCHGKGKIKI